MEKSIKIQGAYVHVRKGKKILKRQIFLFNDIQESLIETVLNHESLHLALDQIGVNPEVLDIDIEFKMKMPLVLVLEMFLTASSSDKLEMFRESAVDKHKIFQEKLRKHQYVAVS